MPPRRRVGRVRLSADERMQAYMDARAEWQRASERALESGRPLTNDEKMKYSLAVMKAYVDLTPEQQLEMLRDSV